ncbi:hypothetical protein P4U99_10915 [Brevibacillus agri]|nr:MULTISPECIES: hypothetical protein [Brevibacillus]MBY0051872.1 hypothetical protein [Brevibacillus agri]MCG5251585.1 hypothetical protein [Brevibacillus agri]MDN4094165.1 hypothetical protein [Brevibacillus agri]MDR9506926.1 hypothetical protein [Brevibacillus agri]MED1643692.1 hypothetical protein [Brevibacillus agri]
MELLNCGLEVYRLAGLHPDLLAWIVTYLSLWFGCGGFGGFFALQDF